MRSWERAAPALACLTPRDRALLRVLHVLHYLTSDQARRACFPRLSAASVRARIGELRRRGLLARLRRDAFADRRVFWGLAPLGRTAAAALSESALPGTTARSDAVAALQLEHLSAVNDLYCDLSERSRGGGLPPMRWLSAPQGAVDLEQTRLVPDATVLVAADQQWWTYFIERDRGTMAPQAMREKFERYALLCRMATAQSEAPDWQTRADAWLVVACDDTSRAERLAAAAADAGLDRVWAGRAAALSAGLAEALADVVPPAECPSLPTWAAGAISMPNATTPLEEGL